MLVRPENYLKKSMNRYLNIVFRHFRNLNSGYVLTLSYLLVIGLGTLLLLLPFSTNAGKEIGFLDSLFTSASAVCVTGLIVVDTATTFTIFGKVVCLFLMQVGGLGFMTFTVLMSLSIGKVPAMSNRWLMQETFASFQNVRIWNVVKSVFLVTFLCEVVGALLLAFSWVRLGYPLGKALFYGIFHSVSAFCNAGFALYPDSFEPFRGNFLINITTCLLIIIGGIGFFVIYETTQKIVSRSNRKYSLHSRLVLTTTLVLIIVGAVSIYFFESNNAMSGYPVGEKILGSLFQSVTARTAGFNTLKMPSLSNTSLLVLMVLMFIGASPGSCGGGIRTTSLAVVFALVANRLKGNSDVHIWNRSIPHDTVYRIMSLIVLGVIVVSASTIFLLATQPLESTHPLMRDVFVDYLFEVISAIGTVGLSLGITPIAQRFGKAADYFSDVYRQDKLDSVRVWAYKETEHYFRVHLRECHALTSRSL